MRKIVHKSFLRAVLPIVIITQFKVYHCRAGTEIVSKAARSRVEHYLQFLKNHLAGIQHHNSIDLIKIISFSYCQLLTMKSKKEILREDTETG